MNTTKRVNKKIETPETLSPLASKNFPESIRSHPLDRPPVFCPPREYEEYAPYLRGLKGGFTSQFWQPKEGVENPRPVKKDFDCVPVDPRTGHNSQNFASASLKEAWDYTTKHGGCGIQVLTGKQTGVAAFDFDVVTPELHSVLHEMETILGVKPCVETSKSGFGIRVLVRPQDDFEECSPKKTTSIKGCKEAEFFYGKHWAGVTAHVIKEFSADDIPIVETAKLNKFLAKYFDKPQRGTRQSKAAAAKLTDEQLAEKLLRHEVYQRLRVGDISGFPSRSEAVEEMAYILAHHVDDPEQIKRIMDASKMPEVWKDKWTRVDSTGPLVEKIIADKIKAAAPARNNSDDVVHYERRRDGMYEHGYRRGNPIEHQMSTFHATLIAVNSEEYGDGRIPDVTLTLLCGIGDKTVEVTLPPEELEHTSWVGKYLAPMFPTADILPGYSGREFRAAILQTSPQDQILRRIVYRRIGWFKDGGQYIYITHSGAIGMKGLDTTVRVSLGVNFRHFSLPAPPEDAKEAMLAVLEFMGFRSPEVMFPALAAMIAAVLGNSRLTVHLVGQPGAGKTELACLLMRLFGYGFTSAEPCATWSATANAIVGLLAQSAYAPFWVDDLIVDGDDRTIGQVGHKIDEVVGAQGNGQGRDRCGRDGKPLPPLVLLGLLLSTGEGWFGRESRTARTLQLSLSRDDLDAAKFQAIKAKSHLFSEMMAAFIQWAASRLDELRKLIDERIAEFEREEKHGRHARYGRNTGLLVGSFELLMRFAFECGAIDEKQKCELIAEGRQVIVKSIRRQSDEEVSAKPHDLFLDSLRVAFATGEAKLIVIENDTLNGKLVGGNGERAKMVGYVVCDDVYLLPTPARAAAIAAAPNNGVGIPDVKGLGNVLKTATLLASTDKDVNTKSPTIPGYGRGKFWHLKLESIVKTDEQTQPKF